MLIDIDNGVRGKITWFCVPATTCVAWWIATFAIRDAVVTPCLLNHAQRPPTHGAISSSCRSGFSSNHHSCFDSNVHRSSPKIASAHWWCSGLSVCHYRIAPLPRRCYGHPPPYHNAGVATPRVTGFSRPQWPRRRGCVPLLSTQGCATRLVPRSHHVRK